MEIRKLFTLFISILLFVSLQAQQPTAPLGSISQETGLLLKDDATRLLIHHSSGDRAHNYVQQLALWDRQQHTQHYEDAAEWVKRKALDFGLQQVEIEHYTADGKVTYYGDAPQPFWYVKTGEIHAVSPYSFKIASYDDLPMSLSFNSASVDTTTEIIYIGDGNQESDYTNKDVKNKIVLTTGGGAALGKAVYQKGAIGIISSASVPPWDLANRMPGEFFDQVGWGGVPPAGDGRKGTFAFKITGRRLAELKLMLDRGEKITAHVKIETELKPANIQVVSGIIKGAAYPDDEIVVTAHLDHYKPGANDNASGSASVLEIVRTMNELIAQGRLPRPLRSIRFLWVPEFTGTIAWFSRHANDRQKRILNLNFDMLGADLVKVGSIFSANYTPDWNASYINALTESVIDFINRYNDAHYPRRKDYNIISVNGSRNRAGAVMQPYSRGSDHQIFNDFGIPGVGFVTWPDAAYHTSQDVPANVDPTQLHRVIFGGLALISTVAYADNENASELAALVYAYGEKRIASDVFKAQGMILSAAKDKFPELAYRAQQKLGLAYERERKALMTCAQLCPSASAKVVIDEYVKTLGRKASFSSQQLRDLVKLQARRMGLSVDDRRPSEYEKSARTLIPVRIKGQELVGYSLVKEKLANDSSVNFKGIDEVITAKTNELKALEVDELRLYQFTDAISSYVDGIRSVADIKNAIFAEYGTVIPLEILRELFGAYEKAGVVRILRKGGA